MKNIIFVLLFFLGACSTGDFNNVPIEDVSTGKSKERGININDDIDVVEDKQEDQDFGVKILTPDDNVYQDIESEIQNLELKEIGNSQQNRSLNKNNNSTRSSSKAVQSLLDEADGNIQNGNLPLAISLLERAQRIAPRDPQVIFQLSEVYFKDGQLDQAKQIARKGILMSVENSELYNDFNELIQQIDSDSY